MSSSQGATLGTLTRSANPLDLLSDRQLLIWLGRAHGRPMARLARVLSMPRQKLYLELYRVERLLRQHPRARARPAVQRAERPSEERPYHCPRHDRDCPASCGHLRLWLARHGLADGSTPRR